MRSLAALAWLALAGCTEPALFIERPWPVDQAVVVVVTDEGGESPVAQAFLPGETIHLERAGRLRLFARTFPAHEAGGPNLAGCGVAISGEGPALPSPIGAYDTQPFDASSGAPRFELEAEPRSFPLTLAAKDGEGRCTVAGYPCGRVSITLFPASDFAGEALEDVAAISDDLAFFSSSRATTTTSAIGKIDRGVVSRLPRASAVVGATLRIAWDHGGQLHGVTDTKKKFELGLDGGLLGVHALTSSVSGVDVGLDGIEVVWGATGVHELLPGSGATVASALAGLPYAPLGVRAVRRSRIIALTADPDRIFFHDGSGWRLELEPAPSFFEKWDEVGGDDSVLFAVDRMGLVITRDDATRAWVHLPPTGIESAAWFHGAALGEGHLLVVGRSGAMALWTGAWCTFVETGSHITWRRVSAAPSRRVAWAVSGAAPGTGGPPMIAKIELPGSE